MSEKTAEKQHTQFVSGGIYERKQGDEICQGTLIGSKSQSNGKRIGVIYTPNYAPEKVLEQGTLDAWTLVQRPVPVAMFEALRILAQHADGLVEVLREMPRAVRDLRAAQAVDQAPTRPAPARLTEGTHPLDLLGVTPEEEEEDDEEFGDEESDEGAAPGQQLHEVSLSEQVARMVETASSAPAAPQEAPQVANTSPVAGVRARRRSAV